MESLSRSMMRHAMDVPCPECSYPVWVLWAEIAAGTTVTCPCCRIRIRLVDETGSVQTAPAQMQAAVEALGEAFRRRR